MLRKTLIVLAGAAALGCLPMATTALAAPHAHGAGSGGHYARSGGGGYGGGYVNGPIYDSCAGYGYGYGYGPGYGCPGYGVAPIVGGVINGVLGGGYRR